MNMSSQYCQEKALHDSNSYSDMEQLCICVA